jgi:iron complex outermembrane receptor protein
MQYGVPAERYSVSGQDIIPDERTRLMMRQQRTQWLVEHDQPLQGIAQVRVQYEVGQYQHQEFANGEEAAVFRNQQKEGRIEAQLNRHMIGASEWRNVVGAQHRVRRFAAMGAESPIVPATTSRDTGLFWISELDHQHWRLEGGLRQSQVQHQPHDVQQSVTDASRQFSPRSMSLGAQWKVVPNQYVLGVQWQRSDRAPSIEELYVNGAHEGTRTYETGNTQLALERSQQVELSAAKISGDWQGRVSHYQQRFSNYIYGQLTGDRVDETGAVEADGEFRALNYQQAAARYMGNEAELWWRKMQLGWSARGFADAVRGHLNDANLMQGSTVLPRLPAQRIGLELHYRQERYRTHISWTHVARVDRLATYETPTAGYDLVNLGAEYTLSAANTDGERRQWIAFATIRNALNEDIRLHTSFTKEFVPQAGRAVVFGVRGVF